MLLVGVLAVLVGAGAFVGGLLAAPIDLEVAPPPTAALLLAADGRQIATLEPPQKREDVEADEIPEVMRQAIISAEDANFLEHNGVDLVATMRAAFRDLSGTGPLQGGSTLTQQYVKNAYVDNDRSAIRKIREAALAVRLEKRLTKQEIITDYLNAVYLGNGAYGVQAAAKYYFDVPVKDLDLNRHTRMRDRTLGIARASMLAGIAPAPSSWNPVKDFTTARARQSYTLNRMVIGGYITPQEATAAFRHDVRAQRISPPVKRTPEAQEFVDYVTDKVKKDPSYSEDVFYRGGLTVRTTLDLDLQKAFYRALREVLPDPQDPQAAIVAVDYRNGDIKAMATLRRTPPVVDGAGKVVVKPVDGYQPNGFNLATAAKRSTGSTIKTFTLAQALSEGHTLSERRYGPAKDTIRCPRGGCLATGGFYTYGNAGDGERGTFSLKGALAKSVNTIYVPLAIEVGRDKVAQLAEKAGLAPRKSLWGYPGAPANFFPFGIGAGVDVTPLAEAVAYGTFANDGVHVDPRAFTEVRTGAAGTDPGEVLVKAPVRGRLRVVSSGVAKDVVTALTQTVEDGTATEEVSRLPLTVFGKTGTTNNSTDAWFTGCLPELHVCVASWMGHENTVCDYTVKDGKGGRARRHVDGPCGGMKGVHGFEQVYGGTLPARIFTRAQEVLAEMKAEAAARAAGLTPATASPSPTATATRKARTGRATTAPTAAPTAAPTVTRAPAPAPTTPPPVPQQTSEPPSVVPTRQPEPSPSPSPSG